MFRCRIDHWDMEKERLVLLTTKSVLIIHFDFIRMVVNDFRRILLSTVNRVQIGDLVYPATSVMPSVLCIGYCFISLSGCANSIAGQKSVCLCVCMLTRVAQINCCTT